MSMYGMDKGRMVEGKRKGGKNTGHRLYIMLWFKGSHYAPEFILQLCAADAWP